MIEKVKSNEIKRSELAYVIKKKLLFYAFDEC